MIYQERIHKVQKEGAEEIVARAQLPKCVNDIIIKLLFTLGSVYSTSASGAEH